MTCHVAEFGDVTISGRLTVRGIEIPQTVPAPSPEFFTYTNADVAAITAGMPVTIEGYRGKATLLARSQIACIALAGAAPGLTFQAQAGGRVVLPTAVWDAVTGNVGGLTPGARYFLSDAAPGFLTILPPTTATHCVVYLGAAKSPTELIAQIGNPILL